MDEIDYDNWQDYEDMFENQENFECTNDGTYGLNEYRIGCPQDCSSCEFWNPSQIALDIANTKFKQLKINQNDKENQLRVQSPCFSGGNKRRGTKLLYRGGKAAILSGQAPIAKRCEFEEKRN